MQPDKVVIIVQNSSGQLFVHQRSADRDIFPLLYGLGAGGHVESGESPIQAAKRELKEELDIEIELEPLFSINFESDELKHIVHVFQAPYDGKVKSCKEFKWSGWMNIEEVDQLAEDNKLCPDTKVLYEKWKNEYLYRDTNL
jgi:8-oxo-dGTP pyrophosphatase MutT (NUDIX family)